MEANYALKGPPALLEQFVLFLIPPAARETVAGDLCELYCSPSQYLATVARTVPFVVASQIRRNVNVPVLFIQSLIIFVCSGGLLISVSDHVALGRTVAITLAILSGLLVLDAYQGDRPPSAKWAILQTIIVSAGVLTYSLIMVSGLRASHQLEPDLIGSSLFTLLILPFGMPGLCGLRAVMVVAREKQERALASEMSPDELALQYTQFERRARRRNRTDIGLLLIATAAFAFFYLHFALPFGVFASGIEIIYLVAAVYLSLHGGAPPLSDNADFLSLRSFYRHELEKQHQLRSFIIWLWPTPVLFAFYASALGSGKVQPMSMVYAIIAATFLCFLVAATNRERNGQVRELTDLLCRMRERRTH